MNTPFKHANFVDYQILGDIYINLHMTGKIGEHSHQFAHSDFIFLGGTKHIYFFQCFRRDYIKILLKNCARFLEHFIYKFSNFHCLKMSVDLVR